MGRLTLGCGRLCRLSAVHGLVGRHVLILIRRALCRRLRIAVHRLLICGRLTLRNCQLLLVEIARLSALGLR